MSNYNCEHGYMAMGRDCPRLPAAARGRGGVIGRSKGRARC